MGKTLKIEVTDEQSDALAMEAKHAGMRFFDHCRAKLLRNTVIPVLQTEQAPPVRAAKAATPAAAQPADDRLGRLEAMMVQLADAVNTLAANPPQVYEPAVPQAADVEVDFDDVVTGALGEADRQGLAMVEREPAPQNAGGIRSVGPRPRPAYSVVPAHLRDHFG